MTPWRLTVLDDGRQWCTNGTDGFDPDGVMDLLGAAESCDPPMIQQAIRKTLAQDVTSPGPHVYEGVRGEDRCRVRVDGKPLPPRNDIRNHSPDGFEWGYGGSGPAQLALAILAYEFGDEYAKKHYQQFKFEVISGFKDFSWRLTSGDLARWAHYNAGVDKTSAAE
jgi:hypothetical protein